MSINGVTVLAAEAVTEVMGFWVAIGIAVFAGLLFFVIASLCGDPEDALVWLAGTATCVIVCVILRCEGAFDEETDRHIYKVIIDDQVPFTEIYDNYEVIDHDGQIWTLKDMKEDNK